MGRSIIYDRRFIQIEEKFIPIFQCGSSNTTEIGTSGREVPEKYWTILNYGTNNKVLFTKEEIIATAKNYSDGEYYKTYSTAFKNGEFEKWYINGMKHAQPIEYYANYGNSMYITEYGPGNHNKSIYVNSTYELLAIIEKNEVLKTFTDAYRLTLKFTRRDLHLPKQRRNTAERKEYPEYYTLKVPEGYLLKKTKYGYEYTYTTRSAKKFKTEKAATTYLEKYETLKGILTIEHIAEPVLL